ncbi:hypothetical protein [Calidifontibacter terrae]
MTGEAIAIRALANEIVDQAEVLAKQRMNVLTASANAIIHLPTGPLSEFARASALTGAQLEAYTASLTTIAGALNGYAAALETGNADAVQRARNRFVAVSRAEITLWTPSIAADRAKARAAEQNGSVTAAPPRVNDVQIADVELAVHD